MDLFGKRGAGAGDGAEPKAATHAERVRRLSAVTAAACALAVVGVGFGAVSAATAQARIDEATAGAVETAVTVRQVAKGQPVTADSLTTVMVPESLRAEGALSPDQAGALTGVAAADLPAGTQITPSLVTGTEGASSLSDALARGKVAVGIGVDSQSGLAGLIRIGDNVRVLARSSADVGGAAAETICASARVVALDSSLSQGVQSYSTVTVEATPEEAARIEAALLSGKVGLAMLPTDGGDAS